MLLGLHVSAAGGVQNAPVNAKKAGGEVFQMFSRPPQGGKAAPITPAVATAFRKAMKENGQAEAYIHTPYYINLASANNRIRYGSISVIREELERGSALGCAYIMTHLGSASAVGEAKGLKMVSEGLQKILDGYKGSCGLLLEMSAGSGAVIGDTFEDLKVLLSTVSSRHSSVGICLDTCHAFASGYDLRDKAAVDKTFEQFDRTIGHERLKLIHANDSAAGLGEHKDRHAHIGHGKIGLEGFRAIVGHPQLKRVNLVLETPHDGKEVNDLKTLKRLRDGKA